MKFCATDNGKHTSHNESKAKASTGLECGPFASLFHMKKNDNETPNKPSVQVFERMFTLIDVLAAMGMDCTVDLLENEPEEPPEDIRLEIEGPDAGRIIGKKGQTLSALQFLTNRVVNRPTKERRHVIIDAEGYRERREDSLTSLAKKLGERAVDEGKIITFEPMPPQDRRIVHLALAKFPGVVTKSGGEGDARRVQIIPVGR